MSLYQEGFAQVLAGSTTFDEIACLSYTATVDEGDLGLVGG